jgi:hypothetical protein
MDKTCLKCNSITTTKWYTGPKCNNCYRREIYPEYKLTRKPRTPNERTRDRVNKRLTYLKNIDPTKFYGGKKKHTLKKYGISPLDYADMLLKQGGVCAVCKLSETCKDKRSNKVRDLAVDHCHTTGRVRGLLCSRCNKALGGFKDNAELLASAIGYLNANKN